MHEGMVRMIPRSFVMVCLVLAAACAAAPKTEERDLPRAESSGLPQPEERGLKIHEAGAFEGLNLFSPLQTASTYLIDNEGRLIHKWESEYRPSSVPYLLPNGNLLRPATFGSDGNRTFHGGGAGYGIEEYTWGGEKIWEFFYSTDRHLMHHDVEPLPNGNVLILAWEMKTKEETIAAGRNPDLLPDGELWPEHIIEVKPVRPEGGEIVWEWHLWDHLIQDFDETKDNYGDVAAHPELVELDPPGTWKDRKPADEEEAKTNSGAGTADWLHVNAIAYDRQNDLIALSALRNNEVWILDHGTTTEEAKGHGGGRYDKGGDLLYRWGNPMAYRLGEETDRQLFRQHDVHWIPEGRPGAGNLLVFNNGSGRPEGTYSTVVEIDIPFTKDGGFRREEGAAWGPPKPVWEYSAPNREDFNSGFISGSRRQPNGNTLICEGATGTFFEVTANKQEVWRYRNPVDMIEPESDDEDSPRNASSDFLRYAVFRVYRYARDYPGFAGKDLTPGPALTDYLEEHPAKKPRELDDEPES